MIIDKLLKDFFFHCQFEKNLNPKTLSAYSIDIEQFKAFNNIASLSINDVDKDILKDYIRHMYSIDLKPKSIKRKLATLKSFFNYLEFEEIILVSPFRKMRISIKEQKALPKTIDIKNIRKLFTHVYKIKSKNEQTQSFAYKTLARDWRGNLNSYSYYYSVYQNYVTYRVTKCKYEKLVKLFLRSITKSITIKIYLR